MSTNTTRHYYVTASALLNNIGVSHHRRHDAQNAMLSYSESIRMRKELAEFNESIAGQHEYDERGRKEAACFLSNEEMQSHLQVLQQQQHDAATREDESTPPFIQEFAQSEQSHSNRIGVHYFSEPLQIDVGRQRPAKSCLRGSNGGTLESGYVDEEAATVMFNVAILHLSQSNHSRARQVLELAIGFLPEPSSSSSPPLKILEAVLFNNLGYSALCEGDVRFAVSCFQRASSAALDLSRAITLINQDSSLGRFLCAASVATLFNLARACDLTNLHKEALDFCQMADEIATSTVDYCGLDLSSFLYVKAHIYLNLKNARQALELYQTFVKQSIAKYGSHNHPYIVAALQDMARLSQLCDVFLAEVGRLEQGRHAAAA